MPTQISNRYQNLTRLVFTLLRIFIGWHFLYEGLAKLFSPWSSAGYLMESQWLLSGLFNRIAENQQLLHTVDILTIIGLILVGIGLFRGTFYKNLWSCRCLSDFAVLYCKSTLYRLSQ